jgi:N-methylhydantoinase B
VHQPISVLSFGQGLQHPAAVGVAGGMPGSQSGFAILPAATAASLVTGTESSRPLSMPTAGMVMHSGEVQLVISQGGGGFGDPLERSPGAVADDVAEGLVSEAGAERDYGVVLVDGVVDTAATESLRTDRRRARLGGRTPVPATTVPVAGRRISHAFAAVDGAIVCRRCGSGVCSTGDDLYGALAVVEEPASARAPLGLVYAGSEQFVIRSCCCPHCGRQVDVQISRRDEPLLRAIESL